MSTSDSPSAVQTPLGTRPGLSNVVDIIVAPNSAFARLREVPTWGWAFLVTTVLGIAGALLYTPALLHAMDVSLPAKLASMPQIAKLPPDQQQSMIAAQVKVSHVFVQLLWLFAPVQVLLVGVLQAVFMTIGNAISRGDGSFKKYFALSINVQIVGTGLLALVLGIIVLIRGAGSFEEQSAVTGSAPSLALLMPGIKGGLAGFLGALNIFSLWATALIALGMTRVGRVSPPVAWTVSIFMLVCAAGLAAWGAAQNG